MAYEQRDNSGSLFKNDKDGNEKRPDYTGKCMVNGEMKDISAWIKKSASGTTFMSLAFKEPWVPDGAAVGSKFEKPQEDDLDEIPFS